MTEFKRTKKTFINILLSFDSIFRKFEITCQISEMFIYVNFQANWGSLLDQKKCDAIIQMIFIDYEFLPTFCHMIITLCIRIKQNN